jgi:hypothetical protein
LLKDKISIKKLNEVRIEQEVFQIRLFNVLPLRTNIVCKNICIDTCTESTSNHFKDYKKENNQYNLWDRFFKLNKRVFKKGPKYTFSFMIRTDGVSGCSLFVRTDNDGKALKKTNINKKFCEEVNTDYIENTDITNELRNMS